MKKNLLNLLLMILSLVVFLSISEFVISKWAPQNLSGSWRISTDRGLLVNKSSGTAKHQSGRRIVRYSFYEPHLRDTPVKEESMGILVVGDSFTFGWLLDKENTYISHLQRYTDNEFGEGRFQYLNAAAGGWGTADYVAFIEDYGVTIKPDIILVFINFDDIGRSIKSKIYTLSDENKLELDRRDINSFALKKLFKSIPGYQWCLEHSHMLQLIRKSLLLLKHGNISNNKNGQNSPEIVVGPDSAYLSTSREHAIILGRALFSRLKSWCDHNDVFLYVTTTGWRNISKATGTSKEPTKAFMSKSQEFFNSINVTFSDISPHVSETRNTNPDRFIISGEVHPNEEGSKLIADKVWKFFLKKQLHEYCQKQNIVNQEVNL